MDLLKIFRKEKSQENKEEDKVRFIFEMPRSKLNDFINEVWRGEHFIVRLNTDKELDKIEKLITKRKKEAVFEYGE